MAKKKEVTSIELNGKNVSLTGGPVGVYRSAGSVVFDVLNYLIIGIASFTTVMPIIYIICNSFATELELQTRPMFVIPNVWSTDAYKYIFASNKLLRALGNSVLITVSGTAINLFFTVTMAYALSKKYLRGRNAFLTVASLIFYAFGEPVAMLLMLLVVAWSWGSALLMAKCRRSGPKGKGYLQVLRKKRKKRTCVSFSISANIPLIRRSA